MDIYYTEKFKKNITGEKRSLVVLSCITLKSTIFGYLVSENIPFRFNGKDLFIGEE